MKIIFLTLLLISGIVVRSQQVLPLYSGLAPGSLAITDNEVMTRPEKGRPTVKNVSKPTLTIFLPKKQNASRTAVIICPGGGYLNLSIEDGGYEVAKQFAEAGITACVLKYRTWIEGGYTEYRNIPMQDLQRGMKMMCENADKWNIDTTHVGIIGFSAGGHLTTMAATMASGFKPAFTILVYPVISFTDSLTSRTSKTRGTLLGKDPKQADKMAYSPELHITGSTPPAFLIHAEDDSTSLVGNSISYYRALVTHKVPAQLLIYQKGGHGFALYNKAQDEYWKPAAIKWLALNGFYSKGDK